jgi:ParB family chromosome partitioning protein
MPTNESLAPEKVGVKDVRTDDLRPNPHNPRVLFDRLPLQTLKTSISKVGILVPLTVYWDPKRSCFTILDGQRRWM